MPRLIFLTIGSWRRSTIPKHKNTTKDRCKRSAIRRFDLFLILYEFAAGESGPHAGKSSSPATQRRPRWLATDASKHIFFNYIETLSPTEEVSMNLATLMKTFSFQRH